MDQDAWFVEVLRTYEQAVAERKKMEQDKVQRKMPRRAR